MLPWSCSVRLARNNYNTRKLSIKTKSRLQKTDLAGFSRYLSHSAKGRRNHTVHSDLMLWFVFLIAVGTDQPRFTASSWERMKMSRRITFVLVLRAACVPFVICNQCVSEAIFSCAYDCACSAHIVTYMVTCGCRYTENRAESYVPFWALWWVAQCLDQIVQYQAWHLGIGEIWCQLPYTLSCTLWWHSPWMLKIHVNDPSQVRLKARCTCGTPGICENSACCFYLDSRYHGLHWG